MNETPSAPRTSRRVTRRGVLGGTLAAGGLAAVAAVAGCADAAPGSGPPEGATPAGGALLLRGGTVITMNDDRGGVLPAADVLIENGRITAVGSRVAAAPDAQVLDVTGRIVMPGLIDTHRHMWQSALRGIGADQTLPDYSRVMFGQVGPVLTPEDMYTGSLLGALEALDSGVTTVVDWSHNMRTPEHGDAVLDGLLDSGARARLAYGNYAAEPGTLGVLEDAVRLRDRRFPTTGDLVTLQAAVDTAPSADFPERPAFAFARDNGLPVTTHAGVFGLQGDIPVRALRDAGLLSPSITYVHTSALSEESYRLIAASGGTVSVAAESELQGGHGHPPTGTLRRFGVTTSLSVDTVSWFSGDMFTAMRMTLAAERGAAHRLAHDRGQVLRVNDLRAVDVLRYATVGGAASLGLGDRLGRLAPGLLGDVVVLSTDSTVMTPVVEPVRAAVTQAGRAEVDTVVVGGRIVKQGGRLLNDRVARSRDLAVASRDRVRRALGDATWNAAMRSGG